LFGIEEWVGEDRPKLFIADMEKRDRYYRIFVRRGLIENSPSTLALRSERPGINCLDVRLRMVS
jgi:hypothetical protein